MTLQELQAQRFDQDQANWLVANGYEELIEQADVGEEPTWKLTEASAATLAKSYEAFCGDEQSAELSEKERLVNESLVEFCEKYVADTYPKLKDLVNVDVHTPNFAWEDGTVEVEFDIDHETDLSLSKGADFHYIEAPDADTYADETTFEFAVFLHTNSPLKDETFTEMWKYGERLTAYDELVGSISESHFNAFELPETLERLNREADEAYVYNIHHNERGEFLATVDDLAGNEVYRIQTNDEGVIEQIQDGFMKNVEDITGLEQYLISINIIPENAEIMEKRR